MPSSTRRKRCPNGTRFNIRNNNCDPFNKKGLPCAYTGNRKRCQRSTRCNIKTGKCDTTNHALRMKRCPTGYRRNKVTKNCDKYARVQRDEKSRKSSGSEDSFARFINVNDVHSPSPHRSPEKAHSPSPQRSPEKAHSPSPRRSPEKAHSPSPRRSPEKAHSPSPQRSPEKAHSPSPQRSPEKAHSPSPQRSPKKSSSNKSPSPQRSPEKSPSNKSPSNKSPSPRRSSETKKEKRTSFISRRTQKQRELLERNQGKKIKKFIRNQNIAQQKSRFLNSICSDSGVCIAFGGRSAKIIKHFFKDFTGFDYVDSMNPIGEKSDNGFLYSIKYAKESYVAHAVLKSSSRADADNLMYEYGVGMEINKMFYDKYPIFVETYKCYRYKTDDIWEEFEKKTYHQSLKDALVPYKEIDYEKSCRDSMFICVLIQHIDKAPTLQNELKNMRVSEVLNVLYQIYFTLSAISSSYTHYDLHTNNVLLYTPVKNKFIQYHFHTKEGDVISFKSCYVVKMIDYGRCFVKPFSEKAKDEVCDTDECAPNCGSKFGYFFNDRLKSYSIESSIKNESHDLRLLQTLRENVWADYKNSGNHFKSESQMWLYKELLERVHYEKRFGTPEKLETGIKTLPNGIKMVKVNNVTDAKTLLQQLLLQRGDENERTHETQTKLGDLHVYCDGRDMEYKNA